MPKGLALDCFLLFLFVVSEEAFRTIIIISLFFVGYLFSVNVNINNFVQ